MLSEQKRNQDSCDLGILGLGWIGKAVADRLKDTGYALWGTVSTYEKAKQLQAEELFAYVLRLPDPSASLPGPSPRVLLYTLPPRGGQKRSEQMIQDAIRMAEEADVVGAIYLSSTSVYTSQEGWVDETDAKDVESRHSGVRMKRLEDQWSTASFPTTILRLGGLFGPGRKPGRFMQHREIARPNQYVNMTKQQDAVTAIQRVIELNLWGKTLNIVSNNFETRAEFYGSRIEQPKFGEEVESAGKRVSTAQARGWLGSDFMAPAPEEQ